MNRQIDEMEKIVSNCIQKWLNNDTTKSISCYVSEEIYNAGYRKPADVAEEIFAEIENWFELYSEREYSFAEEETSKGHCTEAEAHAYALGIIKDLRYLCVDELLNKYESEGGE